jgi:HlyD family secretion protein
MHFMRHLPRNLLLFDEKYAIIIYFTYLKVWMHKMKYTYIASMFAVLMVFGGCDSTPSTALGTLERNSILIKATASELITQMPISEGSPVKEGDVIVQLDDRRQLLLIKKASANLANAEANLLKLQQGARPEELASARARVNGAKSQWQETRKSFDRAATLTAKNLAGKADLDKAESLRDAALAQLNQAEEALRLLTKGTREEELQQAEAQVDLAKAQLELEQQALEELTLRATRSGYLDYLPKHLGDRAAVGETLGVLLDNLAPYARVYIPEPYRIKLRVGMQFNVHIDGRNEALQGKLRWVANEPSFTPYFALNSNDRARLVYAAELDLPDTENSLPSGLPVQVELPNHE